MAELITLADRIMVLHGFAIAGEMVNNHDYEIASKAIMATIEAAQPPSQSVISN